MTFKNERLPASFFRRDTLIVARELLGNSLVRVFPDGQIRRYLITETEAYCGQEDRACHASKGRTKRTEVMFQHGGLPDLRAVLDVEFCNRGGRKRFRCPYPGAGTFQRPRETRSGTAT